MKLMPTSNAFLMQASACARGIPEPNVSHEPRLISETSSSLAPSFLYFMNDDDRPSQADRQRSLWDDRGEPEVLMGSRRRDDREERGALGRCGVECDAQVRGVAVRERRLVEAQREHVGAEAERLVELQRLDRPCCQR